MRGFIFYTPLTAHAMKTARLESKKTMEEACFEIGISQMQNLWAYERANKAFPRDKIYAACKCYGLNFMDMMRLYNEDYLNASNESARILEQQEKERRNK